MTVEVRGIRPGEREAWCACPLGPGEDGFDDWVEGEREWLGEHHPTDGRLFLAVSGDEVVGKYDVPVERKGRWSLWPPSVVPGPTAREAMAALLRHVAEEAARRGIAHVEMLLEPSHRARDLARERMVEAGFRLRERKVVFVRALDEPLPGPPVGGLEIGAALDLPPGELRELARAVGIDDDLLSQLDPAEPCAKSWLVAREAGRPVGLSLPSSEPGGGMLLLFHLGLVPGARGGGRGAALLAETIRRARAAGAEVYVGSTAADNAAMIRVFEKLGCERVTDRSVYVLRR